jgi:anti-sigma regulatory factor (Ser/Thr protein kinase)
MTDAFGFIDINTIECSFSSNPKFMKLLRKHVEFACEEAGFIEPGFCKTIIFAVDEACTNVIRHTYKMDFNRKITIRLHWIPQEKLDIYIVDYGEKVDTRKIQPRDLSEVRPGQMGVSAYCAVMDQVEWIQDREQGNILHFVKYIKKEKPDESAN